MGPKFSIRKMNDENVKLTITGKNLRLQKFPFRPKLMNYLIEIASAQTIQKFHRCCKHLYQLAPYFIIDTFEINSVKERFRISNDDYNECLIFSSEDEFRQNCSEIDNIWVTKKFEHLERRNSYYRKIVRCSASEILLMCAEMYYETSYKILTQSGNVEKICLKNVYYRDIHTGDDEVPLEILLSHIPRATSTNFRRGYLTPQAMAKMMEVPWQHRIKKLYLHNVFGAVDPELFFKFVKVKLLINFLKF